MEINPGGFIIFYIIVGGIASLACMGILMLLDALKILRFHEKSGIIAYGIIGGIALTVLFFTTDLSCNKSRVEKINTEPEKTK
jgi:hypothetical protein